MLFEVWVFHDNEWKLVGEGFETYFEAKQCQDFWRLTHDHVSLYLTDSRPVDDELCS